MEENGGGKTLPEGEDRVVAPLRPFLEHHEGPDDGTQLRAGRVEVLFALREIHAREERARTPQVPFPHRGEDGLRLCLLPLADQLRDLLELVGHLRHGRRDEHRGPLELLLDDRERGVHHLRILYRCAAELEDDHRMYPFGNDRDRTYGYPGDQL